MTDRLRRLLKGSAGPATPRLSFDDWSEVGDAGVLVAAVETEGLGARAGLRVGDVLVAACGSELVSPSAVNPCLGARAGSAVLHIVRGGRSSDLKLDLSGRYARAAAPFVEDASGAEELRVRLIEEEIERLTARLAELRAELERLKN